MSIEKGVSGDRGREGLPHGVEDSTALGAATEHRVVADGGDVRPLLQRSHHRSQWNHLTQTATESSQLLAGTTPLYMSHE